MHKLTHFIYCVPPVNENHKIWAWVTGNTHKWGCCKVQWKQVGSHFPLFWDNNFTLLQKQTEREQARQRWRKTVFTGKSHQETKVAITSINCTHLKELLQSQSSWFSFYRERIISVTLAWAVMTDYSFRILWQFLLITKSGQVVMRNCTECYCPL